MTSLRGADGLTVAITDVNSTLYKVLNVECVTIGKLHFQWRTYIWSKMLLKVKIVFLSGHFHFRLPLWRFLEPKFCSLLLIAVLSNYETVFCTLLAKVGQNFWRKNGFPDSPIFDRKHRFKTWCIGFSKTARSNFFKFSYPMYFCENFLGGIKFWL